MAIALGHEHDYMQRFSKPSIEEIFAGMELDTESPDSRRGFDCG
jgi:hypothetical protein